MLECLTVWNFRRNSSNSIDDIYKTKYHHSRAFRAKYLFLSIRLPWNWTLCHVFSPANLPADKWWSVKMKEVKSDFLKTGFRFQLSPKRNHHQLLHNQYHNGTLFMRWESVHVFVWLHILMCIIIICWCSNTQLTHFNWLFLIRRIRLVRT